MFQKYFTAFGQRASVWDATDGWASKEEAYWGSMPVEVHNSGAAHYQQQDWPGLDYEYKVGTNGGALAQFRMYYNTNGSWMSPDPYNGSYDFSNPQSFNRYAYVANNPLSVTDPQGLIEQSGGGDGSGGGGCDFICQIVGALESLFGGGGGGGPTFQGSMKPRPNAQPWDEYNIHWWNGANLATALGLPDDSCDFGVCGPDPTAIEPGGVAGTASPIDFSPWVFQIYAYARALARDFPPVLASGMLLSMTGDNRADPMAKGGDQNIVPSWAAGAQPLPGESAAQMANRLCAQRYPPDGAGCGSGPGSERNKIRKWAHYKWGI